MRAPDDPIRTGVQRALDAFLADQRAALAVAGPDLEPYVAAAADLVAGGKRLRPAFCWWGALGAGADPSAALLTAAAALELFQASALVHDDVIDGSDTRRGAPSAHRRFAALHRAHPWHGDPDAFGTGAAILLGDLLLGWAGDLLQRSGLASDAAWAVWGRMRAEVQTGQWLDLVEQARGGGTVESALRVVHLKAATYTVERPLQLGGALAGAGEKLQDAYSAFGLPLGIAFQLRDDLLGVFGDPAQTGKPAGDDLREGKRTVLVALALEKADAAQADLLQTHLGDPGLSAGAVDDLRQVLVDTGAVHQVEDLVAARTEEALTALVHAPVAEVARAPLADLAVAATARTV
jgi:geranylgeranyl diphosphate synthase type I